MCCKDKYMFMTRQELERTCRDLTEQLNIYLNDNIQKKGEIDERDELLDEMERVLQLVTGYLDTEDVHESYAFNEAFRIAGKYRALRGES